MRKVKYKKWIDAVWEKTLIETLKTNTRCWKEDFINEGLFHQWVNSYDEFESVLSNYTIALVEIEDGTIVEVLPCNIKFIKE